MKGSGYRTAGVITGIAIMLITALYDVQSSFVLFPLFAFFLFFYVFVATDKFKTLFFIYLLATMSCEILFLYDFDRFFVLSSLASGLACVVLLLIMRPVIQKGSAVFSRHYLLELIIGFVGVGFIVGNLAFIIMPMVPDVHLFIFSFVIFAITVIVCFIIPAYNKHTDNVALFVISGASVVQMVSVFVYKYLQTSIGFLLIAIFMAVAAKIVLATYLTKIDGISDQET